MTTQIIPGGGNPDPLTVLDATTEFNGIYGGYTWNAAEEQVTQLVAAAGTFSRLRILLTATPGAGCSWTFTVRKGTGTDAMGDTTLTVTISNPATAGDDLVNEVAFAAGDRISLKCVSAEPGPGYLPTSIAEWCLTFTPTTANECLLMGGIGDVLNLATAEYNACVSSGRTWGTTEASAMVVVPTNGTIKDLMVWLSEDPGDAGGPDGYTFTLRRGVGDGDAMASTTLTLTISADDRTGSDIAHDIDVAAGDVISLLSTPVNTPGATPYAFWGMIFVPDVAGEFPVMGGSWSATVSDDTNRFLPPTTNMSTWATVENTSSSLMENCTLKKFYAYVTIDIAAGQLDLSVNDDTSAVLSCSITSGDTGSDAVSTGVLASGVNRVSMNYFSTAGTTLTTVKWGFVGYNAVASNPSGNIMPLMLSLIHRGLIT